MLLKATGASGVICKGHGVQVVYGPKVAVIKAKLEDYLEKMRPMQRPRPLRQLLLRLHPQPRRQRQRIPFCPPA